MDRTWELRALQTAVDGVRKPQASLTLQLGCAGAQGSPRMVHEGGFPYIS